MFDSTRSLPLSICLIVVAIAMVAIDQETRAASKESDE